jgi:hypothetical protein
VTDWNASFRFFINLGYAPLLGRRPDNQSDSCLGLLVSVAMPVLPVSGKPVVFYGIGCESPAPPGHPPSAPINTNRKVLTGVWRVVNEH